MNRSHRLLSLGASLLALTVAVLLLPASSCASGKTAAPGSAAEAVSRDAATTVKPSIGMARMLPDGTIVLDLRAETGGATGDAQFRYPKEHPQYREILEHVGGLEPGQEKPVPPWPENK